MRRDPGKAYISDMLWLPKKHIAEGAVKESLQFWTLDKNVPYLEKLWGETDHHVICPREFLNTENYPQYSFPFVDISPRKFPRANLHSKIELRGNQLDAYAAFSAASSGILNLAPGKGKTILSLKKIVDLDCPALIVVHNTYLWEQWQERISSFLELPIGQHIGRIQGQEFDWQRPITIGMIHSLAGRAERGEIPPEFSQHFGVVIFDEVHHLSAPYFSKTAPLIQGMRFGLTATATRLDGMEFIYKHHIGGIFHTDLRQDLAPRIYFQRTPVEIDLRSPEVNDVTGKVNIPKLRSFIGTLDVSNDFRAQCIREAAKEGRKILALSHSKKQLIAMSEMFPGSGLVIQETPQETRTEVVQKSKICFAINSLGAEGLDDDKLDTLFVLTPFSSPNDLQQFMGRIQRSREGKKTPVVVIFDDVAVPPFHALCRKLMRTLKEWKMPFLLLPLPTK